MNKKQILFINCGGCNAGDKYSSPYLYYDFSDCKTIILTDFATINKYNNVFVIFGGGGIIDTSYDKNIYYKTLNNSNTYFHWGSGSNKLNTKFVNWNISKNEKYFDYDKLDNFEIVGRRDYLEKYIYNHTYVPCVSCKLPQLKKMYNTKRAIGVIQHMWLKQINLPYKTISMNLKKYTIDEIIEFIGESEIIITGSFHAAYWGLLLGKKVLINGSWSSKFDTLKYKPSLLTNNLEDDINKCIIPPNDYLSECIQLNDDFYKKIMSIITQRK
jgi:hypothetical protein